MNVAAFLQNNKEVFQVWAREARAKTCSGKKAKREKVKNAWPTTKDLWELGDEVAGVAGRG